MFGLFSVVSRNFGNKFYRFFPTGKHRNSGLKTENDWIKHVELFKLDPPDRGGGLPGTIPSLFTWTTYIYIYTKPKPEDDRGPFFPLPDTKPSTILFSVKFSSIFQNFRYFPTGKTDNYRNSGKFWKQPKHQSSTLRLGQVSVEDDQEELTHLPWKRSYEDYLRLCCMLSRHRNDKQGGKTNPATRSDRPFFWLRDEAIIHVHQLLSSLRLIHIS